MKSDTPEMQAILRRIETLEKGNRHLKQASITIALTVVAVLGACRLWSGRTVEADKFIVRDKQGRVRAEIAMSYDFPNGNPLIRLLDENGEEKTTLGAGVLGLNDKKELLGVTLLADSLHFLGGTQLQGGKEGGSLRLFGTPGQGNIFLDTKYSAIEVSDGEGFWTELGKTSLSYPKTGETRQRSAASLVMFGKDKKVLWSAPGACVGCPASGPLPDRLSRLV